jgi:hypothetical protein
MEESHACGERREGVVRACNAAAGVECMELAGCRIWCFDVSLVLMCFS